MVRDLYFASTNVGKLREFALAGPARGVRVLALPGLAGMAAPAEDRDTFAGNALLKAAYYSRFLPGELVMADDSGLEVDALGGAPGVRSARFAADHGFTGGGSVDADNNLYLLQRLDGVRKALRGARYCCVLAVARDGVGLLQASGTVAGRILFAERGDGGFGYDPLFYLPALGLSMAELDPATKWGLSHRGVAFRELLAGVATINH